MSFRGVRSDADALRLREVEPFALADEAGAELLKRHLDLRESTTLPWSNTTGDPLPATW